MPAVASSDSSNLNPNGNNNLAEQADGEKHMDERTGISSRPDTGLPPDDLQRMMVVAQPDIDQSLQHLGIAGDTYTTLITGDDTNGRFCLLDMLLLPGGGPPPHRHDFEESFVVLDGEIEVTFRGKKITAAAGTTVNIPSNAPHQFHNSSSKNARALLLCSPAGQENYFGRVGIPLPTRTSTPPSDQKEAQIELMNKLAPLYRNQMLDHA